MDEGNSALPWEDEAYKNSWVKKNLKTLL
jgi:hypothetical protein